MKWADIEDIAEILEEQYPNRDILEIRFTELYRLILDLKEFSDEANKCNEKLLESIISCWLEIRNNHAAEQ